MTDALEVARNAGQEYGQAAAVFFLFAGAVDDDAILVLDEKLKAGDQAAYESLPKPNDRTRGIYAPYLIALDDTLTRGIESPYSWYLDVCDAYDTAFNKAVTDHIDKIAVAIRDRSMVEDDGGVV